jgi:hypothetical protein
MDYGFGPLSSLNFILEGHHSMVRGLILTKTVEEVKLMGQNG